MIGSRLSALCAALLVLAGLTSCRTNAPFNHSATGFPLTGAHATLPCQSCHVNGNYNLTSTACVTCHWPDYNNATLPSHIASGFPTACSLCHSTTDWTGASFNHAPTGFPLTGAHASLDCQSCHANGNYTLSGTVCITCHSPDYNHATHPSHNAAGFPIDCSRCHSTANWTSATFDHGSTGFALTGAHASLICRTCHVSGIYNLTSADCVTCHVADYINATHPNHRAGGLSTDCSRCHTTTQW